MRLGAAGTLVSAIVIGSAPVGTKAAQGEDFAVDNGWFFTQTHGKQAEGSGFAVLDTDNVPFWTQFQQAGGVDTLGFPVSSRFVWDGSVTQAFQRGVLQFRADSGVQVAGTYDSLSKAGLDDWLMSTYAIPRADDGKAANPALLSENASIAKAYNAVPNAAAVLGVPVALEDFGPVVTLRTDKAALSQWKVETNFAPIGGVTIPNAGDVLMAAGVVPQDAAKPVQVGAIYGTGGYYPYGQVATPQPAYYYPYYPVYNPPVVQSAPYYPYYPAGYNYGAYYQPYGGGYQPYGYNNCACGYNNYGYGYGAYAPTTYPYYPYAYSAPNHYPSYPYYPYNYQPYGYGSGYGNGYYGSLPQGAVCQGDEQMTFNPGHPGTNQRFTIEVTSARPHQPFSLRGPGNPQFAGQRAGGKGYIWSWTAQIGNSGHYNYDFVVYSGTVCTANVLDVG